jgi:hypothetical protein
MTICFINITNSIGAENVIPFSTMDLLTFHIGVHSLFDHEVISKGQSDVQRTNMLTIPKLGGMVAPVGTHDDLIGRT